MKFGTSDIISIIVILVILWVGWFIVKKLFFVGLFAIALYLGYKMLAGSGEAD